MMRGARGMVVIVVVLAATWAGSEEPESDDPGGAGVRTVRSGSFERTDVVLPGPLLDWTIRRGGTESFEVLVLSGPEIPKPPADDETAEEGGEEPPVRDLPPCPADDEGGMGERVLFRVAGSGREGMHPVRPGFTDAARRTIVIDDRSGGRILLLEENRIVDLGHDGASAERVLLEAAGISGARELDDATAILLVESGRAALFRVDEDGTYVTGPSFALPVRARMRRDRLDVWTPAPSWVGRSADGVGFLATPPEAIGKHRLRTTLAAMQPDGATTVTECWSRLPEAEDLLEAKVVLFDGVPAVVSTTKQADRLGLFAEKRLRIHPLRRDRSRLGLEPWYAGESRMNLWQDASFFVLDVDRDGRDDLVVGYWKGLKDDRVVLDVYLRLAEGGFAKKPQTTAFDVDDGDRSWVGYGGDVNGDGAPDLVVRADGELRVHRGRATEDGKNLVEREPIRISFDDGRADTVEADVVLVVSSSGSTRVARIGDGGRPRFDDLDGDGRDEIVIARRGGTTTRGSLRVVRWLP